MNKKFSGGKMWKTCLQPFGFRAFYAIFLTGLLACNLFMLNWL